MTRCLAALVLTGALTMACAQPAADGKGSSDGLSHVTVHQGPAPPLDTELIAQSDVDLRRAAAELTDPHAEDFAGSYVNARAEVVIVATTPAGVAMAEKLLAAHPGQGQVETATLSVSGAGDLITRWAERSDASFVSGGMDPATHHVYLTVERQPSEAALTRLDELALAAPVKVDVWVDSNARPFTL